MSTRTTVFTLAAIAALTAAATSAHAGIALQTYTPGASPVDYSSSTLLLDDQNSGGIDFFHGKWFSFTMPHTASLTGITIPINFTADTAPAANVNFGFWFGTTPNNSSFGGATLPASSITLGLNEYTFNFGPSALLSAGQTITIDIEIAGVAFNKGITGSLFQSTTPGTTFEKSLGVIFTGPQAPFLPAIQIRDNFTPEPASLSLLALGTTTLLTRRKKH